RGSRPSRPTARAPREPREPTPVPALPLREPERERGRPGVSRRDRPAPAAHDVLCGVAGAPAPSRRSTSRKGAQMTTSAVRVNVLISGGFSGAYAALLPEFERASGIAVTTGSGASQGRGAHTIAAQLARGVAADVVILSREGLAELIAADRIAAGTD